MYDLHSPTRTHKRLLEELDEGHFLLDLDNTGMGEATTCPRAFLYNRVLGRVSENREALNYGAGIHKALETWQLTSDKLQAIEALVTHFETNPQPFGTWRTLDHAITSIEGYIGQWREPFTLPDGPTDSFVEVPFVRPLTSIQCNGLITHPKHLLVANSTDDNHFRITRLDIRWTGRIDLIVAEADGLWLVDHKTTSMVGDTFWKDFELSSQMIGYTWAMRREDFPIKGVIVNGIVGRKPTKSGVQNEYLRQRFFYTDEQLGEWYYNTENLCRTLTTYLCQGFFPQHTKACLGKYGKCAYHDVCTLPQRDREQMLVSDLFIDNTWNPLNPT